MSQRIGQFIYNKLRENVHTSSIVEEHRIIANKLWNIDNFTFADMVDEALNEMKKDLKK